MGNAVVRGLITDLYGDISGFGRVNDPSLSQQTVNTTYGELTFDGAQRLIDALALTENDEFVDVGCGVGKLAIHVALASPATVRGIEVVRRRYDEAMKVLNDERLDFVRHRIQFMYGDATLFDIRNATVLYMCSTCFPPGLTDVMVSQMAPYTTIVAATPLRGPVKLLTKMDLDCTWSKAVTFYVYVRLPGF
jgi:16S rRNA A1518/A1519 N6-dimethyltransferase RsmA/KsgA/DIM1 with predicted DNA glycosylase/AP lyase activity